jgi:hypothetical protein
MTPNDSQMDVLLRRFAKVASDVKTTDHLDADELNAFAEGALPVAVRSRYVSHLADCDDCRRAVTELATASGRIAEIAVPITEPAATESWWKRIGPLFAPARLRYAAFAAVLVAVVGIGFAVWRRSHGPSSPLLARNNQTTAEDTHTVAQSQQPAASGVAREPSPVAPAIAKAVPQTTPAPFADQKQAESTALSPPPPPKPADSLAQNNAGLSSAAASSASEPAANTAAPSYATVPPVESERANARNRNDQNLGLIHGPQRGESNEKYKALDDRSRGAGDVAKARDEDRIRTGNDQPAAKEESKDADAARKRSQSRAATLASRPAAGERQEEPKSDKAAPPEEADTRTVGGRTFKRQGNAWVDVNLKSSMSIKTISRGSDEFEKLDAGLRSISHQINGPIVVVWKGKAYRIQ